MNQVLRLVFLGSPQFIYQGQPLSGFVSGKVRALLIYLAVTARPQGRDHLAEFFWADTPASSRVNLRKALSNLRGLVGDVLREDGKESILLDPQQVWVDVIEFAQLVKQGREPEALQLYHADFLSGFNFSLSYEFETWALSEQSRLKTQYVDLLRRLAVQQEANHKLGEAISTVRHLLQLEPWHEEAHRWLMELLAKDGQRSAALAHFEIAKRVLKEELDVAPNDETLNLLARIQRSSDVPAKPLPKTSSIPKPEFPLIGRDKEMQIIQEAWQHCLQHGAHFVSIAGEAGIGKTRLTEEARIWVESQGYATVYARSYAAEGALAYSQVVDWLRSEAIRPFLDRLDAVWLNEVTRLLPELLICYPNLTPTKVNNGGVYRRLFLESLARAVLISGEPILLVIDDLQWCDRETLEWLRFLLRFDPDYPLLVIGAYRVEEVEQDHWLQNLLLSLRRDEVVSDIELGMLSEASTIALIHKVAVNQVSSEQITDLWNATTGHPLFVIESLHNDGAQEVQKPIPKKIQSVIQSRFLLLSAEARTLAELAAVIGRSFTPQLLMQASRQAEDSVISGLDELWQRRILVERESSQFDFSHDRIREIVYAGIRPANRQRLHLAVAKALEVVSNADLSAWNAQIAVHYQTAGNLPIALHYFVEAVQILSNRWALEEALILIDRAILIADQLSETDANLRYKLTLLNFQYNMLVDTKGLSTPSLRGIAEQVLLLSEKLNDHIHNFIARTWLERYHGIRAEWIQAKAISEANVAFAEKTQDPMLIWKAYGHYAVINFYLGDLINAKFWFDRSSEVNDTYDAQTSSSDRIQAICVDFYNMTARCYYLLGYLDQAKQWAANALAIGESSNHLSTIAMAIEYNLIFHYFTADTDAITHQAKKLKTFAQKNKIIMANGRGNIHQGLALAIDGHYQLAIEMIMQMIEFYKNNHDVAVHVVRLSMLSDVYRMARRYQEGIVTVDEALSFAERTHDQVWVPELYRLQGELLLGNKADLTEVEDSFQKSLAVSRQQSSRLLELRTSVSLARLWQSQSKHAEAYQLLAPIYAWFTEGFDTVDMVEAKSLLDELTTDQS